MVLKEHERGRAYGGVVMFDKGRQSLQMVAYFVVIVPKM